MATRDPDDQLITVNQIAIPKALMNSGSKVLQNLVTKQ